MKILVPIDGSNMAKRAVQMAVSLCEGKENKSRITLLHVIIASSNYAEAGVAQTVDMDDIAREQGLQLLKQTAEDIPRNGIEVEIIQMAGFPAESILEMEAKESYDLIVMGNRGLGAIGEVILGGVSHKVLHEAHSPVLIVK